MEIALSIPDYHLLNRISLDWHEQFKDYQYVREAIERILGINSLARIYFGQEFCERALPNPEQLGVLIDESQKRNYGFTLVTPFLTAALQPEEYA